MPSKRNNNALFKNIAPTYFPMNHHKSHLSIPHLKVLLKVFKEHSPSAQMIRRKLIHYIPSNQYLKTFAPACVFC